MTKEDFILEKLERIEAQLDPIVKSRNQLLELKEDLTPLGNHAVQLFIEQLQEVEAGFQLEDLMLLAKQSVRSVRNLTWLLHQADNLIEFVNDLEPLLKSAIPQLIEHLDELERKGVFRIVKAMLDVRAKVAESYDGEDIDKIGDGMVALLGLAKKFSEPQTLAILEKLTAVPGNVDLENSRKTGPFKMMSAGFNSEVKEGLGVVIELTKAMGRIKTDSPPSPAIPSETVSTAVEG